jgi:hypothetical protein
MGGFCIEADYSTQVGGMAILGGFGDDPLAAGIGF